MKRRDFLRGAAASAGAAALPIPTLVKPVAAATQATVAGFHYGWACVYAQMNNGIAPADVAEKFGISLEVANRLFDRMLDRGVLHPPGLDGRSHATRQWQPWDQRMKAARTEQDRQQARQRQDVEGAVQDAYIAMCAQVSAALPGA